MRIASTCPCGATFEADGPESWAREAWRDFRDVHQGHGSAAGPSGVAPTDQWTESWFVKADDEIVHGPCPYSEAIQVLMSWARTNPETTASLWSGRRIGA